MLGTPVAVTVFITAASAQQADEEPTDEMSEVEEIIVVAPRPGSRKKVDDEYEHPVRARVLKDLHEMQREQEEIEWREAHAVESPSRIKWGYNPVDDYDMRNKMSFDDDIAGKTKPATLFRIGF
jgi:hypothetical protein